MLAPEGWMLARLVLLGVCGLFLASACSGGEEVSGEGCVTEAGRCFCERNSDPTHPTFAVECSGECCIVYAIDGDDVCECADLTDARTCEDQAREDFTVRQGAAVTDACKIGVHVAPRG